MEERARKFLVVRSVVEAVMPLKTVAKRLVEVAEVVVEFVITRLVITEGVAEVEEAKSVKS